MDLSQVVEMIEAHDASILKLRQAQQILIERTADKCLHRSVREIKFNHAPHMSNRWCKSCFLQESEAIGYDKLKDLSWRTITTFSPK